MTTPDGRTVEPRPLGAVWDGSATTFRVASVHATSIELDIENVLTPRLRMQRVEENVWEVRSTLAVPGTRYGFRAHGPWNPDAGHLFNPAKILLDPYSRVIDGAVRWHAALGIARQAGAARALEPSPIDSAAHLPRSVVVADDFDWQGDRPPAVPWAETVIYECHVKGMTALHPDVPAKLRGTWLGLASEAVIEHLAALGVTAVELLPVHPAADSALLVRNGLTNYWGYATVGFFAPDRRFASVPGRERHEFREMVRRFHAAGIEVLLDVVYNHTGEGGVDGPTVMFRGLDNAAYYRLKHGGSGIYEDFTGCGNTLDVRHPIVQRLVLDSLRFWVSEMHVDGFRFDLAPVLGRDPVAFDAGSALLAGISSDPLLRNTKLIAEPWDLGPSGYQQGAFPAGFAEWNGRYRDTVRRFWRGVGGVSDVATRLSGSSDLFGPVRPPQSSINFITCHDGFSLQDLVSYARKHNLANGEQNRDGADWNESHNWGVEGPSADPGITGQRERAMHGMMATLLLSLGVPMLSHGDELARSQQGNNNPWCQDSALTWLGWARSPASERMLALTCRVLALRRRYAVFRRSEFLPSAESSGAIAHWLDGVGGIMTEGDWHNRGRHVVAVLLQSAVTGNDGAPGDSVRLVLLLNGGAHEARQELPTDDWRVVLDTARPGTEGLTVAGALVIEAGAVMLLEAAATSIRRAP